jgi:hypothetical protein
MGQPPTTRPDEPPPREVGTGASAPPLLSPWRLLAPLLVPVALLVVNLGVALVLRSSITHLGWGEAAGLPQLGLVLLYMALPALAWLLGMVWSLKNLVVLFRAETTLRGLIPAVGVTLVLLVGFPSLVGVVFSSVAITPG